MDRQPAQCATTLQHREANSYSLSFTATLAWLLVLALVGVAVSLLAGAVSDVNTSFEQTALKT